MSTDTGEKQHPSHFEQSQKYIRNVHIEKKANTLFPIAELEQNSKDITKLANIKYRIRLCDTVLCNNAFCL
jgi:hypothetical protein